MRNHQLPKGAKIFRPHLFEFNNVTDLNFDDITTENPPNHHLRINDCRRVRVENWFAYSPGAVRWS